MEWGKDTVLWGLPLGALRGSLSKCQRKIPSWCAGKGKKESSVLNKARLQDELVNSALPAGEGKYPPPVPPTGEEKKLTKTCEVLWPEEHAC